MGDAAHREQFEVTTFGILNLQSTEVKKKKKVQIVSAGQYVSYFHFDLFLMKDRVVARRCSN